MRSLIIVLSMLFWSVTAATAQVSVSIGINVPSYPELVRVPGYPVYYAPGLNSNFFFYDGSYWVYERGNWYASSCVQRPVGAGISGSGATFCSAYSRTLLPCSPSLFLRVASGWPAALGPALGT